MNNKNRRKPDEDRKFVVVIPGGSMWFKIRGVSKSQGWFNNTKDHFLYAVISALIIED